LKYICLIAISLILFAKCSKSGDSSDPHRVSGALSNLTDIPYGANSDTSGSTISLTLDLYFPAGSTNAAKYPLVVMIHGGSYLDGDKTDMKDECAALTDSGFIAASINYRLGWRSGTGQCNGDESSELAAAFRALQDANAAMRFLVAHAADYGIDTGHVFVGGSSAGSITALNMAYIPNVVAMVFLPADYTLLGPVNTADNSLTNTFTIKGICNMWGAISDSNLITGLNALPTISFHGTNDDVVPYNIGYNESCSNYIMLYGSACIQRRLEYYNKPAIANFVIGGGHGPSVYTPVFLMGNTACFFNRLIKGTPITSKVYTTLVSSCND
jgi:poly(3-hydroxybutyrate) depolymerase